jgi:pimeloyl-ACP methyl ester carboxylesterase
MRVIDQGSGLPIVVIPGVQGRWEWMKPGIDALSERCRVITFSLCDEPSCRSVAQPDSVGQPFRAAFDETSGFNCYIEQVREAMDAAGVERAAICGVSYGGLIASTFAARYPERTDSLVLMSALPPSWTPNARARLYVRAPRLLLPLFLVAALRNYPELAAACGGVMGGLRASIRQVWTVMMNLSSPTRMARRVRLLSGRDFSGIGDVDAPTLVITGEAHLDRVVPVRFTQDYLRVLPQARMVTIERTGHLGFITRPDVFARTIGSFVDETEKTARSRRRIG